MKQETNKHQMELDLDLHKVNLWNSDSKIGKKTRMVLRYIEELEPNLRFWSFQQVEEFEKTKARALAQSTPDAMLEAIGYRYGQQPELYDKINRVR
jgi:hypothetical protein